MRVKKALLNTITGFSYEIVTIICGLILPRLILTTFGSDYNGLTSAINQFMRMVVLLQAGLSSVVNAALYKPLADNNIKQVSVIVKTARTFMRKVGFIYIGIVFAVAALYPLAVAEDFNWFFTFSLVLIISLGTFFDLFIGAGYIYLLRASQRNSVDSICRIITLILSTIVSVILINNGFGIHAVKLGSILILGIRPVLIYIYTNRKYSIDKHVQTNNTLIKQRWDSFAQEIAAFITNNTSLISISIFINVYEVSVYSVYMLIINNIWGFITPLTHGIPAAFGNMFAKKEEKNVEKSLRVYEMIVFSSTSLLFGVTLVMIQPFVMLYTSGVSDVDYNRSLFSVLAVVAMMFRCFRLPYTTIVGAVGHFKQTRNGAFAETAINITLTLTLIFYFGIIGVTVALLAALTFRTFQYAIYVSRNVVKRNISIFLKRLLLSFCSISLISLIGKIFELGFNVIYQNYKEWIINAVLMTLIAIIITITIEVLFYRKDIKTLLELLKKSKGTS